MTGQDSVPVLDAQSLGKAFGRTVALKAASLTVMPGEVHALIGENGAGKSTLVNIVRGQITPDNGQFRVTPPKTADTGSHLTPVAVAFQELSLVEELTVGENLLLGRLPAFAGTFVSFRRVKRAAQEMLREWDADDLDPSAKIGDLPLSARQRVELVRALSQRPALLLLDEPTSALSIAQTDWLFRQIERTRATGTAVLYISHRMHELRQICDRGTVLREGRTVADFAISERSDEDILAMMISEAEKVASEAAHPATKSRGPLVTREPVLRAHDLRARNALNGISLALSPGEIVGVAALEGHGQAELFASLFGASDITSGEIELSGRPLQMRGPWAATRSKVGIGFVPEDRTNEGLLMSQSILTNVALPALRRIARFGFVTTAMELRHASSSLSRLAVRRTAWEEPAGNLSGGNQQKVILARWLASDVGVLLLFDPARGVDAGTKAEIATLARSLADEGKAILYYSSEIEELVRLGCDRVITLYDGKINAEIVGDEITRRNVLNAIMNTPSGETGMAVRS